MPAKKQATRKTKVAEAVGKHAAVQVTRPDADVYYIDEAARERYESKK